MALVKFYRCCNFYLLSNILGGVFLGILSIQFISLLNDLTFLGILFIKMILVLVTIATSFVLLLFLLVAFIMLLNIRESI